MQTEQHSDGFVYVQPVVIPHTHVPFVLISYREEHISFYLIDPQKK